MVMQPKAKPQFKILSTPLEGDEAENSKKRLRALLDDMALQAREKNLTEEGVIELLKNDG
jgi:hypothetical protein